MICPLCQFLLSEFKDKYECENCGYVYNKDTLDFILGDEQKSMIDKAFERME